MLYCFSVLLKVLPLLLELMVLVPFLFLFLFLVLFGDPGYDYCYYPFVRLIMFGNIVSKCTLCFVYRLLFDPIYFYREWCAV